MKKGLFFLLFMVAFVFKGFSQSTPADSTEMYAYIDSVLAEARGPINRTDFFNLLTTFNSYMALQGVNGTGLLSAGDTASMLTPYINRSDTAAMLASYTRYVEFLDSVSDLRADLGAGAIQPSDTAAMLQSYIQRSDTAGMLSTYTRKNEFIDSISALRLDITTAAIFANTTEALTYTGSVGENLLIAGNRYIIQSDSSALINVDTAIVVPISGGLYAILTPEAGGCLPISVINNPTVLKVEKFINYAAQVQGCVNWDTDITLIYSDLEDIDLNYDVDIYAYGHKLLVPQTADSGITYNVFTMGNNVDVRFFDFEFVGDKDGRVSYSSSYTLSGTTVTIAETEFDNTDCGNNNCDQGRFIYLNGVRKEITAVGSTTTVTIEDATGVAASGTAVWYRQNSNRFLSTGGSDIPSAVTITTYEGQRYIKTASALGDSYIDGYIYITIDGQEYERRITEISNDTLFFSNALPDVITTLPTTANIGKWGSVEFHNCDLRGQLSNIVYWDNNISGGDGRIAFYNNKISSGTTIAGVFANNLSKNVRLISIGNEYIETGIAAKGDGNIHPRDPNGIGFYLHPHVNGRFDNDFFYGNYRDHIKWFSSSDNQTTIQKYGSVTNCQFISGVPSGENKPYDIILRGRGIVDIDNCHGDGKLQLRSSANISNSSFKNVEIFNPRDSAKINISNSSFTQVLETTGAAGNFYWMTMANVNIYQEGDNLIGLRASNGQWSITNSEVSIIGANAVAVQNQGADFWISDTKLKAFHTSGNFQALNFNATTYNDREFVLTDVEILDGQIALSGNSTYSDEIYMEDVYFNEDAISSSLRLLGNDIDTVVFNRKRTGGFIVAQYFAGAKELNLSQAAYYEISINANGGDIRLLKPWNPATIGSNIELFDEFKLNFISGANFTNGTDFTFEKTYEAGDWAIIRYNNSTNKWYVYEDNQKIAVSDTSAMLAPYAKSGGWAHYIDTAYSTAADSFYVAQGSTLTLPIKADMTAALATNYLPNGVDSLFSQHDSTILGITTGASYTVRVTFKAKNSNNTGYATIALDIGTGGTPNITTAESLVFPKGAGVETQESKTILLYSLDTFVANGCKIKVTADTGNLEIYDIRLLIRLDSRP